MMRATLSLQEAARRDWDALVLGAGPAGALAARRLAIDGARVLLVEKKAFPRFKVCGACLNREALSILRAEGLGTLVDDAKALDLDQFHVRLSGRSVRFPLPEGKALSRERFDAALVQAAIAEGVDFLPETTASTKDDEDDARPVQLDRHGESVTARARVVLVAAGLGNHCADAETRLATTISPSARIGAGCMVDDAPDELSAGAIHMAVGRGGYVGMVRVEDGRLNVAAAFDTAVVRRAGTPARAAACVLAEAGFPAIDALEQGHWQGTVGLTRATRPVAARRLFLLGDAAGYVEPFTGQGMAWALTAARAVAPIARRAITCWAPELEREWARRHNALVGRRLWLCRALCSAIRRPAVARLLFSTAARVPGFSKLLIHHVNSSSQPSINTS
jgi:menaquinone-9 beta-reductase